MQSSDESAAGRAGEIWQALAAGAAGRAPALRQFVLCTATTTATTGAADGRLVVLRHVDVERAALTFYSDQRAAKMQQLHVPAAAVFWDPQAQVQVRLQGGAAAVTDIDRVDACWARVGAHGRQNYRALQTPGSAVARSGLCAQLSESSGRENFAVVQLLATRLDALWLARGQRLHLARAGEGARWVQV